MIGLGPKPIPVMMYSSNCPKCGHGWIRIEFPFKYCPYCIRTDLDIKEVAPRYKTAFGKYLTQKEYDEKYSHFREKGEKQC